jgi:hypothetical protein
MFSALTVLGSEVVLFWALKPAGGLSIEILNIYKPG